MSTEFQFQTWFYRPAGMIVSVLVWIFGGVRIEGLGHVPASGATILVSNHISLTDAPLSGWASCYQIGRVVHLLGKVEVQHWPIIG